MRTPIQPDSSTSNPTDTREVDGGAATTGRTPSGMFWGEAFWHAPFADNPALIEAMGNHFDPNCTHGTR